MLAVTSIAQPAGTAQLEASIEHGFEEKSQKGDGLRLTCVTLAEHGHGLSTHCVHGEGVILGHLQ